MVGTHTQHTVEQNVEWAYCFDTHCNSFVPVFVINYLLQLFLVSILYQNTVISRLLGNSMYLFSAFSYNYITFLGYSGTCITCFYLSASISSKYRHFIISISHSYTILPSVPVRHWNLLCYAALLLWLTQLNQVKAIFRSSRFLLFMNQYNFGGGFQNYRQFQQSLVHKGGVSYNFEHKGQVSQPSRD
jgi:hypothetical protein